MKKSHSLISLLLLTCTSLVSCSSFEGESESEPVIDAPLFVADNFDYNQEREYPEFTFEKYQPKATSLFDKASSEKINAVYAKGTDIRDTYNKQLVNFMPSTGDVKLCIVPVVFNGRGINSEYYPEGAFVKLLTDFYFGKSDSNFLSVAQYYNENSFGKLKIDGLVTNICETKYTQSEFFTLSRTKRGSKMLAQEMYDLNFSGMNPRYNVSSFDGNKDGSLDGLVIVPMDIEYKYYDHGMFAKQKIPYCVNSLEYMLEKNGYFPKEYYNHIAYMLGMEENEYKGESNYSYERDYSHSSMGLHNASFAYNMGWTIPTVIDSKEAFTKKTISLNAFQKDGSSIILGTNFNGTCYDEYFMIEYVNDYKLNNYFNADYNPETIGSYGGIYLYHIDQRLGHFVFDPNVGYRWDRKYSDYMELEEGFYQILASNVRSDREESYNKNYSGFDAFEVINCENADDVYALNRGTTGTIYNGSNNPLKFHDGSLLPFKIEVGAITNDAAKLTITYLN